MDVLRQRLAVCAQLTAGTTLSNYLDNSPSPSTAVKLVYAHGLVNAFRVMYSKESPQGVWDFIKHTMDDALDQYTMAGLVPGDDVQLLRDAITGITSLTVTYQNDYQYVGTIRVAITHWERKLDELLHPIVGPILPYDVNTPLGDSYSAEVPLATLAPLPVPQPFNSDHLDFSFLKLSVHPAMEAQGEDHITVSTSSVSVEEPASLVVETPVLDQLNSTVNVIAAQSQVKVEIISRAQQRWLDMQQH